MTKLSSNFTASVKQGFLIMWIILFVALVILSIKIGILYLLLLIWLLFFVAFMLALVRTWRKVVDFYVDHDKKEILLDNLMGKRYRYLFSQLLDVNYKFGYRRRVKVTFSDKKSFIFYTKDFWLFELATKEGFEQNIKREMNLIQMQK